MLVFHCLKCFNEWGVVARSEDANQQCTLAAASLLRVVVQLGYQGLQVEVKPKELSREARRASVITLANEHYQLATGLSQPWITLLEMHHREEIMHYPGTET